MLSASTLCRAGLMVLVASMVHAASDDCSSSLNWVFIDIHYRAVDARPETFSYGLFIGAGTASQNQSLWPSISQNETRMASNDFCTDAELANCDNSQYTHGHFSPGISSTRKETSDYAPLDDEASYEDFQVEQVTDTLNLFTHFFDPSPPTKHNLSDYPISVLSNSTSKKDIFFHAGSLGLGPASTVLRRLQDDQIIDRNVVGMYLGTKYPRAGGTQNGSIVMGGYDAGRMVGQQHKYPMVPAPSFDASSLKVHVKQMSLVTSDGTSIPLVTDDGFDGFISTNQYEMQLPEQITNQLSQALEASPTGDAENTLILAKPFDGNITITLEDGYEITYPSEWISNVSNISPFAASTTSSANSTVPQQPFIFGTAFLHHLYLTIDYDAQVFFLADAKPFDNYVQPQVLCVDQEPIPIGKTKMSKFIQTGAIGAIVGGLVGGAALIFIIFYVVRKRLQYKQAKSAIDKMEGGGQAKQPKKSSLRKKTKSRFLGLVKPKKTSETKDVRFGQVKRISWTDEEEGSPTKSSSAFNSKVGHNGVIVTIERSEPPSYEMSNLALREHASATRTTTLNAPEREDMYNATPLPITPYTATTPRTGNPLLGGFRGYETYNDADDSDIPASHRSAASGAKQKGVAGLSLDTTHPSSGARVSRPDGRTKPPPLPLGIGTSSGEFSPGGGSRAAKAVQGPKTKSMLRKMFPA